MNDIHAAIAAARSSSQLDEIVRALTAQWARGALGDEDYSALYGAVHRRRADLKEVQRTPGLPLQGGHGAAPLRRSIFPPRKPQRSPDRRRSLERRRRLAASGPMPPALAARFTVAELACLRIVADEVRAHGDCSLTLEEIAARAGVCRTSCQNALRAAARAGLLHVEERRQRGAKNLPNVVTITSAEWRTWLTRGPKHCEATGFKNLSPTAMQDSKGLARHTNRAQTRGEAAKALEREPAGYVRASDRESHEALGEPPSAILGQRRVD